ncbi:hypothetical protein ZWY2020_037169 [Hordeum vulgare]|nr:hypothetical protein ZWY2020_037169 [Hordeum vulgare]
MAMAISSGIPAPCSLLVTTLLLLIVQAQSVTRHYNFNVQMANVTRLCGSKSIVTVNGEYPGPALVAREGDRVVVRVTNRVAHNVTLHWHGIRQLRSGWADGPAYVTQCPIQTGQSYAYDFTVTGQRGTLWWHAHISWLRATVYGAIVVLPKHGVPYPFPAPHKEVPVIFGEWWRADTEAVVRQALRTGGAPNVSDAFTINGPWSALQLFRQRYVHTFKLKVEPGKTYMLRLINAALNDELFFRSQSHAHRHPDHLSGPDHQCTPHRCRCTPGPTSTCPPRPTPPSGPAPSTTPPSPAFSSTKSRATPPRQALTRTCHCSLALLRFNDTGFVTNFTSKLRSLATPAAVPRSVDKRFFFTVGLGTLPCPANTTCQGRPTRRIALHRHVPGVYGSNFPVTPLLKFNYTGAPPNNTNVAKGTKLLVLPFNASVELVMQDTSILGFESHPLHLHGFNFFVVGQGFGNYDAVNDPAKFNLVDPVERNTVGVPAGGWVAIRFLADNPGVWFMHCHLEVHTTWGLRMAWLVLDGSLPNQKLPPHRPIS